MWEDTGNRLGGKWVLTIPKNRKGQVDQWWLNTVSNRKQRAAPFTSNTGEHLLFIIAKSSHVIDDTPPAGDCPGWRSIER